MEYFLPKRFYRCFSGLRPLYFLISTVLVVGVFFLGLFLSTRPIFSRYLTSVDGSNKIAKKEVFGFAPFWTISKLDNVDWKTLTTFAYFSIPVLSDGSFDRTSYEWQAFQGIDVSKNFDKAKRNGVRRVVTLTQMDPGTIEAFLGNRNSWKTVADESIGVLKERNLDGVNIDFEYIPRNDQLRAEFSDFADYYSKSLKASLDNPYVTVSVLASSARYNKIYDVASLSKSTDGLVMMAYDFYTAGSDTVGPSAPLGGYNNGQGPYWYDVQTAVDDFLKVADPGKVIMGVPYYGWNYTATAPSPNASKTWGLAGVTTEDKLLSNKLLQTTPIGGWDNTAKVSWRGYFDSDGWHIVYMEDAKSLGLKYDLVNQKKLKGVGIWALGYDSGDSLWAALRGKFNNADILADADVN